MMLKFINHKTVLTSLTALTVFLPMTACDLTNNYTKIDRSTNNELQDYRDAMAPREVAADAASGADTTGAPELEAYVSDDSKTLKSMPLVSLSINQSIPLREALFELSKQADYDIELDPRISGSIIFTARNKPMDEVIDRICEISGLRYKFDNSTLRIELDTPYSKTYKIDYLSFVRKNKSSVSTDVSVKSEGDAQTGGGSTSTIDTQSDSDFWAELDTNLKQILGSNASPNYLKTESDPQISLTTSNPVNPPAPPIDAAALGETAPQAGIEDYVSTPQMVPADPVVPPPSDSTLPSATATETPPVVEASPSSDATVVTPPSATAAPQPISGQPAAPAQQPVLRVESLPTNAAGNASGSNQLQFTPAYSINKQAGIVSVYANERIQKQVQSYLNDLRRASTSQVLIEAKVLEVTLSDEFSAGIDWSLVGGLGDFNLTGTFLTPGMSPTTSNGLTVGFAGSDISSFVSALSRFGVVHALASPRLTVLNNQAAVLNVAKNQVYFEIKTTSTPITSGASTTNSISYDVTAKTVPEGVLINVMPSIDLDGRMVSLQVRPTVTKIDSYVDDPSIALNGGTGSSKIPVMNVQEIDSVINMKDKQMMVMGGLLQDNSTSSQQGVPVASEVPVLGSLFRNQGDKVSKKELVIFMKSTILDDPSESVHQTDKDIYRTFGQDRRPEKL